MRNSNQLFFALLFILTNCFFVDAVRDDNLVVYYSFDGNASDFSGHSNEGKVYGANLTKGVSGQAYRFDGVDDYIFLGYVLNEDIKDAFTIGAWIKLDTGALQKPHNYVFWKSDDSPGIRVSGDKLIYTWYYSGNDSGMISNTKLNENQWYYVTYVFNGSDFIAYINGLYDVSRHNTNRYSPGGTVKIGADEKDPTANRQFKGSIDEIKIWDYALSEAGIREEYESAFSWFNVLIQKILCKLTNLFDTNSYGTCVAERLIRSLG